ncbi:MAG: ParB/RepB/Spo0J family partition protein [Tissierellia bacterium]|jgi:ParB family chromosome partitioning protein|nr:ParB/RepB/Spo0J family partition protein [Bacillota bacterium]NLK59017.1 ParB/RepB/Spo0J family partition protein [Tissierellia bacterium]
MAKRRGLGRGLEALLSDESGQTEESVANGIVQLKTNEILPRSDQPRQVFEEEKIAELADSIKRYGVLQPLVVTKMETGYTLIAGERRLRAAKAAGLEEVPAIVREATPQEVAEISLVENIQREDLDPVEEARAYKELMAQYGYTQQQLAGRIGKSRSYIANAVRLLQLDEISLSHLIQGEITSAQARTLLSIQHPYQRQKMLDKLLQKKTNVRQMEKAARRTKKKDIYEEEAENRLMLSLGTKVQIIPKKKGGKIEVEYYNAEDLERLLELLEGEGHAD